MHFDNVNDARRVLDNTLIRIGGVPVYANRVNEEGNLEYFNIKTKKRHLIDANSKDIDTTPVQLGFVNGYGSAVYVSRATPRVMKQGLSNDNMVVETILRNEGSNILADQVISLKSELLINTIDGDYPSFADALKSVTDGDSELVAFSRHLAISKNFNIYHRTAKIGKVIDGKIVLNEDKEHYSWVLE